MRRLGRALALTVAIGWMCASVEAQERDAAAEGYLAAVAAYFGEASGEIAILAEWGIDIEEIPTALFVAERGGVSAEAVVALRRGGAGWGELVRRYGIGAGALHVYLPDDTRLGSLASAFAPFDAASPAEWENLVLADADVVALVNVHLLVGVLDRSAREIVEVAGAGGSFVAVFDRLRR